jgi:hypothetical protein
MEMYGKERQATDDNTTRRKRFTCSINKPTDTLSHSQYVIVIVYLP